MAKSGRCAAQRAAIGKAHSRKSRGHALQKYMACKRGHKSKK